MKEIWVPIKDFEGLYEVSNFGNVRSLNYNHTGQKRILKLNKTPKGYLDVQLCKDGKNKHYKIHRLVADAFIPNWFGEKEVNHIDENKENNKVDNLEWCSASYNCNYGTRNKRVAESQSKPVLQYTKNGEFVREWSSTQEAGRNGYCHGHISKCCNGKLKSHAGFIWKYKKSEKQSA